MIIQCFTEHFWNPSRYNITATYQNPIVSLLPLKNITSFNNFTYKQSAAICGNNIIIAESSIAFFWLCITKTHTKWNSIHFLYHFMYRPYMTVCMRVYYPFELKMSFRVPQFISFGSINIIKPPINHCYSNSLQLVMNHQLPVTVRSFPKSIFWIGFNCFIIIRFHIIFLHLQIRT